MLFTVIYILVCISAGLLCVGDKQVTATIPYLLSLFSLLLNMYIYWSTTQRYDDWPIHTHLTVGF